MKGLAVNAITAVASAALEAGRAVAGFVGDSVNAAATFEASVNGLAAVAGDALSNAGISLEDVSQKALQLGADTQFSAQEAIQAMTELAKGGVPVIDVMNGATDATLALAAAAGTPLATAAEIVAKQLGVWSETGVTAAEVTDLIASAANASTVGVEDLALGLAQAGGTAKTAGVEFGDLVQTMALIAPNFSSASDAGTSLKTFLSRLIPTTGPAIEAMAQLGLYTEEAGSAFFNAQGEFIGMEAAAGLLQTATAGLSEEQKLLAFNTIFGSDAIRAAAAIANAGAPGFAAMGQAMADSGGAAEAAATKQQGFAFAMEQLKGSVETLQIVIGTALLPVLTPLIEQFTAGVNQVMAFAQAMIASGDPLAFLTAQVTALNPAFTTLLSVASGVAGFIQGNLTPILAAAGAMILAAVIPAFVAWAAAAWTTAAANLAALAPILIPIALIGAAAALLAMMWEQNWFGMRDTITSFWEGTGKPIFDQLVAWLGTTLTGAIQTLTGFWNDTLLPALTAVWAFIQDPLMPLLSALGNVISAVVGVAVEALAALWKSTLQPALATVGGYISDTLQPVMTAIADVLDATVGPAVSGLTGFFDDAKTAAGGFKGMIDGVIGFLNRLADTIRNIPTPDWPEPPSWLGGGSGDAGGARAAGGPVAPMGSYLVGEHGPELFVPASAGGIVPATATAGIINRTTNNNFNMSVSTNAAASTVTSDFAMMKALAGVA